MKKKVLIAVCSVIVLAAVGVLCYRLFGKEKSYRSIRVQETVGITQVTRGKEAPYQAYNGMRLEDGDFVAVGQSSNLVMKMDEDKFVYADENTRFHLEGTGSETSGKITVHLEQGSVLVDIQEKLSEESEFEIETPNSVMSVRGTVFYVETVTDATGALTTKVCVFDGAVAALGAGESEEKTVAVEPGKALVLVGETKPEITVEEADTVDLPENMQEQLAEILVREGLETPTPTMTPQETLAPQETLTPTPTPQETPTPTIAPEPEHVFRKEDYRCGVKATDCSTILNESFEATAVCSKCGTAVHTLTVPKAEDGHYYVNEQAAACILCGEKRTNR